MAFPVSVGETVQIQFSVFDVDGITPLTGLGDVDFGKQVFLDDATSAEVLAVDEIAATGVYVAEFVPNANGLWYLQVASPIDDVWECYVKAGPPPDDWIVSITEDVWSEILPGSYLDGSAGSRLAQTSDDVALLRQALIMANLTAVVPGSTSTVIHTAATQVDDFYNGLLMVVRNADGNVSRRITDYTALDGAFTLSRPLPFTPDDGDQAIVLGIMGEVVLASDSLALEKLCDVHNIMGLDPEDPLCISKQGQKTNRITLKHTEVGKKVIVQRES